MTDRDIRIPRFHSNDSAYIVVEWLQPQDAAVRAGDHVVTVETSKSVEELECEYDGLLHQLVSEGAECWPGSVIGRCFATSAELADHLEAEAGAQKSDEPTSSFVLTEPARELAARYGLSDAALAALGRKVIRAQDVEALLAKTATDTPASGTTLQDAVADVVTRSHREIPTAFTVIKVHVDAALAMRRALAEERHLVLGLPDLVIRALGMLGARFPAFYTGLAPEGVVDVGVTIDVGTGLFLAAVPDAGAQGLGPIAESMMDLRKKALRRRLGQADLGGAGAIALTLSHEPGVVLAQPLVYPGHVCMVSMGGVLSEVGLEEGTPVLRNYVNIGVAFDHRIVNGREAVSFLSAIKGLVEDPQLLDVPGERVGKGGR